MILTFYGTAFYGAFKGDNALGALAVSTGGLSAILATPELLTSWLRRRDDPADARAALPQWAATALAWAGRVALVCLMVVAVALLAEALIGWGPISLLRAIGLREEWVAVALVGLLFYGLSATAVLLIFHTGLEVLEVGDPTARRIDWHDVAAARWRLPTAAVLFLVALSLAYADAYLA